MRTASFQSIDIACYAKTSTSWTIYGTIEGDVAINSSIFTPLNDSRPTFGYTNGKVISTTVNTNTGSELYGGFKLYASATIVVYNNNAPGEIGSGELYNINGVTPRENCYTVWKRVT